ncbi:MAG: hypothetical protein ACOYL8_04255 [Patescibacteria group bacterium]
MKAEIIEIFKNVVEYKNFGLNALTISAIATILFSILQAYGILKQNQAIREKESGESISTLFFFYNFFYFFIFFIYGISEKSLAMSINGALSFLYIPILSALRRFKGFTKGEVITALLMSLVVPAVIIYEEKHQLLFLFSCFSVVAIVKQFKEISKEVGFGALSVKYIWMFFITSIFWCIYFAATNNWLLEIPCVIGTTLYAAALILEKTWREQERLAPLSFKIFKKLRKENK